MSPNSNSSEGRPDSASDGASNREDHLREVQGLSEHVNTQQQDTGSIATNSARRSARPVSGSKTTRASPISNDEINYSGIISVTASPVSLTQVTIESDRTVSAVEAMVLQTLEHPPQFRIPDAAARAPRAANVAIHPAQNRDDNVNNIGNNNRNFHKHLVLAITVSVVLLGLIAGVVTVVLGGGNSTADTTMAPDDPTVTTAPTPFPSPSTSSNTDITMTPIATPTTAPIPIQPPPTTSTLHPWETKLTASDGVPWAGFGFHVAIDGNTLIVGVLIDNDNGNESGAVYLYQRMVYGSVAGWTEQAKLIAGDGGLGQRFGCSVGIHGDNAVVGACWDDDTGVFGGSLYIFGHSTVNGLLSWTQQAKLTASDGATGDEFGYSVAIDGSTLVVGGIQFGSGSGFAYVYSYTKTGSSFSWTEQAKLVPIDSADGDHFGISVAISGNTVVVGAYLDDDNGDSSGSAYIYKRSVDGAIVSWSQQAKLTASDGANGGFGFGYSVSISNSTLVIGAPWNDMHGSNSGSAYLYQSLIDG